ncbi:hypothetical protein GCM10010912_42260 [Paenibacillus albidus]|uniref:Uncharacterized protein n=1 Tax=Paenibacillus albidus TaxID=2041023 RepID=A0A917CLY0_9BACL|nr:hypothetical protein [Paenibacillus albidus]GGF92780.1 hypothetical protein GCM10010912_42260 [Paenibacillus albidus]
MMLTKKVKTIGVSAIAVLIVASMSTAAFAASNEKDGTAIKVADKTAVGEIEVYDLQNNEIVNTVETAPAVGPAGVETGPDTHPGGSEDSVPATPAVKPLN